ncbi:SgcJ/EcaC family oxidoreductase [Mycolicibacterium sp. S2-37]|uniref:SgcJ/EcaC family oxidoreductase n=1 Tax=Mycolicibacterium sp. S2-37 TaxID=2810297 RepID=UPI001A94C5AA|nr:SgcJ/EcaC family oxidoreductase [Mycolicibacterium sp. S2-37]MBO0678752.1 SgcJ/EcaC family oxidoreductase [Mycolicibacterium sp. S2-37]
MGAEQVIAGVMDEWKAAVDSHDPVRVAAVFTEDAVFQGLRPYGVGRQTVADYYDSQPAGMTVTYRILENRRPADGVVLGYLAAVFSYPHRPAVRVAIGVLLTRAGDHWRVAQYQASPMG